MGIKSGGGFFLSLDFVLEKRSVKEATLGDYFIRGMFLLMWTI